MPREDADADLLLLGSLGSGNWPPWLLQKSLRQCRTDRLLKPTLIAMRARVTIWPALRAAIHSVIHSPARDRASCMTPSHNDENGRLAPALEQFLAEQIASGRYRTEGEVIQAGLRLLQAQEDGPNGPASPLPMPRCARARRGFVTWRIAPQP